MGMGMDMGMNLDSMALTCVFFVLIVGTVDIRTMTLEFDYDRTAIR